MGQCVSRSPMAPYAAVRPCDSASLSGYSLPVPAFEDYYYNAGQSDSKGARKRSTTPAGRGAAMSFGFRKKGSGAHKEKGGAPGEPNPARRLAASDKNGNGGSTEELFTGSPVMSGRSTPLARPRKETSGQPLRTNRFGFRQTAIPKTAKVGDVNMSAEQALNASLQDQESKNNNIFNDKSTNKPANSIPGLIPTQVGANGIANINTPKPAPTKQTIILTYSAKQYPASQISNLRSKSPAIPNRVTIQHNPVNPRSVSASRAYSNSSDLGGCDLGGYRPANISKYTLQSNQLPKLQYPSLKLLETKFDKQVANNTKKGYGSSDGSSKEGSMTEDSGVGTEHPGDWSPRASRRHHRRPRTLEMVMRGEHSFHLRELQLSDLDIMVNDFVDEAIVTDVDVIPLPKLPSTFDKDKKSDSSSDYPPINRFSRLLSSTESTSSESQQNRSHLSTLDRYRSNRDRDRIPSSSGSTDNAVDKGEEKVSRDRIQREKDCTKMSSNSSHSPLTRNSSKESSPSTKSEESHLSAASGCSDHMEAWMNPTAGESMALRSNDDISVGLSLSSSCDEERGFEKSSNVPTFTQARVDIVSNEPRDYAKLTAHPMMLKSLTLNQNSPLQSMFMSTSMSSSAFSANSDSQQFKLLTEDPNIALAALASSNQSLIDDETSPADSLISSSSDSNNEMPILEKDTTVSSSAYHTADNKTAENVQEEKEVCEENATKECDSSEKPSSEKQSPRTPGTPSNSLSLSEGRDFLIDDEIADQPALIFESLQNSQKAFPSPLSGRRPVRSPSLDTLSPCDSIASDDLICDMDLNHSLTSLNSQDEYIDRLDGSIRSGLNSMEDAQLREELLKFSLKRQHSHGQAAFSDASANHTPTKAQGQTPSTSNSSITNIGASLPARTARLLGRSRASTPEATRTRPVQGSAPAAPGAVPPPDDGALRLERAVHGSMQQDIVSIKAMLLKLKRVLQEPEEGHNLMRTETLNPLDIQCEALCPLKNGPSLHLGEVGEASPPPPPPAPHEEVADLRRQLVFLQSQLEERERMVKLLQEQMSKYSEANSPNGDHKCNGTINVEDMCNVATQTERLRPISQGSNLLQGLGTEAHPGGLVSWNEQKTPRKISSLNDFHPPSNTSTPTPRLRRQVNMSANSPPSSDGEIVNGKSSSNIYSRSNHSLSKQDSLDNSSVTDTSVQLKTNCRVGSRYLQAITNKNKTVKTDTPPSDRTARSRSLYTSRSKSIENFHSTPKNNEYKLVSNKSEVTHFDSNKISKHNESPSLKHHTSCNNIFNGSIDGHSECNYIKNNNSQNGYTNGNTTDVDEHSDGGYKSLPLTINLLNGNKASGIPRRAANMDLRFSTSKQAQTNKC